MRAHPSSGILAIIAAISLLVAESIDVHTGRSYQPSDRIGAAYPESPAANLQVVSCCVAQPSRSPYLDKDFGAAPRSKPLEDEPVASEKLEEDRLWEARYFVYQELISQASAPLTPVDSGYLVTEEGTSTCLLHGRSDVEASADRIIAVAADYPSIPPIMVAASIAEQASDIERIFGVDILERTALALPGKANMSIGIAQLRPTEAMSLGLGTTDLFDPDVAVRGMYAKLHAANQRIDALQDPQAPIPLTDRLMLLSLAQNDGGTIDRYFAMDGGWNRLLSQNNSARVMRYFLVHLDWLVEAGWDLPDDVDLDRWRRISFSSAREVQRLRPGRRS